MSSGDTFRMGAASDIKIRSVSRIVIAVMTGAFQDDIGNFGYGERRKKNGIQKSI